jgi:hypothetical protein
LALLNYHRQACTEARTHKHLKYYLRCGKMVLNAPPPNSRIKIRLLKTRKRHFSKKIEKLFSEKNNHFLYFQKRKKTNDFFLNFKMAIWQFCLNDAAVNVVLASIFTFSSKTGIFLMK